MAIAITCRDCGFLYAFKGDGVEPAGPLCPQCQAYAAAVEVEVDLPGDATPEADYGWFVIDRIGTPISGPFGGEGDGYRWIMRQGLRTDDYPRDSLSVSYLPFPRQASTATADRSRRTPVIRERVPALVDALDVTLALWIAEASLADDVVV